jgi:pimeloyl-ACP methyl ester carboxylesterase
MIFLFTAILILFLILCIKFMYSGYNQSIHEELERDILNSFVKTKFEIENVFISDSDYIHTMKSIHNHEKPNLLVVHGFGGGIAVWCKTLDDLSQKYYLFVIDLLGFGLSSKPTFLGKSPEDSIAFWVDSIEKWRNAQNLEKFAILGHSLGALIAIHYSLQYPKRIEHLFLATPIGIGGWLWNPNTAFKKIIVHFFLGQYGLTPQSILRSCTPFSWFIWKMLKQAHSPSLESSLWEYLYMNQVSPQCGDLAFVRLLTKQGIYKILTLDKIETPITLIYGETDYIHHEHATSIVSNSNSIKYFVLQMKV